jgi:DNA-binding MarR family transcriptional regulator
MILALLYPLESADFLFLLRETGLTRGNLSAHLSKLEEADYITVEKGFRGKIPQTTYSLTEEGRAAFRNYREQMKRAVDSLPE